MIQKLVNLYEKEGGEFVSSPSLFVEKLNRINVVMFDWDGVFNNGTKRGEEGSIFSEVDAMGTNLLRYALWRYNGNVPVTAIVTGENNPSALQLGIRESFHAVYTGSKNKVKAFRHLCEKVECQPAEVLFFFDDVLDLEVAKQCGARVMIGRSSGVLFKKFVREAGLADYITANDGGNHGLREAAELIIGLNGHYQDVIQNRMEFSGNYQLYLTERKKVVTEHIPDSALSTD